MKELTYGSVCSGIESASAAWEPLGWRARWFAEIEPFPCAVLAHHYPDIPNLGDISTVDFADRAKGLGPIDILVGGTPCQAFSVAGKRRSLQDDRGNLTLVFCRIVERLNPWCVLWENVPGILSTADNAFGCFLAGLVGASAPLIPGNSAGRWPDAGLVRGPVRSAVWGILNAQHFGLAQRRRRVFVASLRAGDWRCPAAILFEPHGLPGHPAPSGEAEPSVAPGVTPGARRASGQRSGEQLTVGTITAKYGENCGRDPERGDMFIGFQANGSGSFRAGPMTLAASDDNGSNQLIADTLKAHHGRNREDDKDHARESDTARCLDSSGGFASGQGGTLVGERVNRIKVAVCDTGLNPTGNEAGTVIAFQERGRNGGPNLEYQGDRSYSLDAPSGGGRRQEMNVAAGMAVRRLMPEECEKLQGFEPGYTNVPFRGKPAADGPRYKAIGNSKAVTVIQWLGRRVDWLYWQKAPKP